MTGPRDELLSAFSWLLASGKYSDLTIICGSRRYAVHKALLCSRSRFFDGACSRGFQEGRSGVIDLSDDDEEAVHNMIEYFYNLDYFFEPEEESEPASYLAKPSAAWRVQHKKLDFSMVEDPLLAQAADNPRVIRPPTPDQSPVLEVDQLQYKISRSPSVRRARTRSPTVSSTSSAEAMDEAGDEDEEDGPVEPNLLLHAKMYAIAEKYEIHGLKELARHKFELDCFHNWEDDDFADAAREVYHSTVDSDRGLRGIVIQTFRTHPQLARRKDVVDAIKDTPPLAFELYRVSNGMPV